MARIKLAGTSGASENTIIFSPAGGHSHNGKNSSLIDSTAYSIYDFSPTFVGTEVNPDRAIRQENNRIGFEDLVKRVVNNAVLRPAGIRLDPGTLNGSLIIANTITASQLAANTITADEIAANAITADKLSANIVLINNVISSNNYNSNAKTGWTILSNGYSEFRSGVISNWTFNNTSISSTVTDGNTNTHSVTLATSGVNLNTDIYNWSNTPIISMTTTASNSSPNGSSYHAPGGSFFFAGTNVNMDAATYIRPHAIHLRDGVVDTNGQYYGGYIDEGFVTMNLQSYTSTGGGNAGTFSLGTGGFSGASGTTTVTTTTDAAKALRLALIKKTGSDWVGNNAPIVNYLNLTENFTHIGKKLVSPNGMLMGASEFIANSIATDSAYSNPSDFLLVHKADNTVRKVLTSALNVSFATTATTATYVAASGITGQTGMWTSTARPGPYRLYRRDENNDFSVQTYWTGSRWRLYGYQGDTSHADTHVGYADSAGNAGTVASLSVHSGRNNEADKIVRTDINGYLQAGYINSSSGYNENNSSSPDRVWGSNAGTDSYLRTYRTSSLNVNSATTAGTAGKLVSGQGNSIDLWYVGAPTVEPLAIKQSSSSGQNAISYRNGSNDLIMYVTDSGNVRGTGGYTTLSDRNFKENITYADNDFLSGSIDYLKPAIFNYIGGTEQHLGFIAQDVQEFLPDAVKVFDEDRLGLDSNVIIAALVAKCQQLETRLQALEAV